MSRPGRILLPALLALAAGLAAQAATWEIEPSHSAATFTVRHLMIANVRGEFGKVGGTVEYDESDPTAAKVTATIDATTIDTREPKRDEHLRSADFFDVAQHKTLTFTSKRVEKAGPGKLKVVGDLTIRAITREVTLEVEGPTAPITDPWGNVKIGAVATTRINRSDFGLTWNRTLETGGVVVSDEVQITIDVELVRK